MSAGNSVIKVFVPGLTTYVGLLILEANNRKATALKEAVFYNLTLLPELNKGKPNRIALIISKLTALVNSRPPTTFSGRSVLCPSETGWVGSNCRLASDRVRDIQKR